MSASELLSLATGNAHWSGEGSIKLLEQKFKNYYKFPYAVAVPSATLGLLSLVMAMDAGPGDEIITSSLNIGYSVSPFLFAGCTMVLLPIDPYTFEMESGLVEKAITTKTKAILAADMFGIPHQTHVLKNIADRHEVLYLADAAQSFRARIHEIPASGKSDALVVSFTSGKTLDVGEGGMLLTRDPGLYEQVLWWTQHPHRQQKELSRKLQNTIGINARLNPYIASRALIEWSSSAKKIRHRKYACQSIVTIINDHDMTEPIRYCTEKISPSFFRLPAIWKHEPKPGKLIATLHANGADISLSNLPFGLLSQNPVLRQQFNQQCRVPFSLAETENLVRRSFCMIPHEEDV